MARGCSCWPLDNNAFLVLDISGLKPATYKVTQVTAPTPSSDASRASDDSILR